MHRMQVYAMVIVGLAVGLSAFAQPVLRSENGHYYEAIDYGTSISWTSARDQAAARTYMGTSGHLVTVTSAAENQFIVSALGSAIIDRWMGGYQDRSAPDYSEPAGGWKWITGEPWSYTNWGSPLQPDNAAGGTEDYLNFIGPSWPLGTWNDYPNNGSAMRGYVVEYPVPEPASVSLLVLGVLGMIRRRR